LKLSEFLLILIGNEKGDIMMKAIIFFILLLWVASASAGYAPDSVRIAYIGWGHPERPLPQEFLQYAKATGYNYILCEYCVAFNPGWSDWDGAGGTTSNTTILQTGLAQHFKQVDDAGLRLIPEFQLNNPIGNGNYLIINKSIPVEKPPQNLAVKDSETIMSPDTTVAGAKLMYRAFDSLWTIVYKAFKQVQNSLTYRNLDFVDIGCDEGHVHWINSQQKFCFLNLAGLSKEDTAWLFKNGLHKPGISTETQIQRLYAANLKMRVSQIISIAKANSQTTKVLLFADMFDPDAYPSCANYFSFKNLFDPYLVNDSASFKIDTSLQRIRLTGTLAQSDLLSIKDSIIFIPWCYNTNFYCGGRYIPHDVIDTITRYGYRVLCSGAGDQFYSYLNPQYYPTTDGSFQHSYEFAVAAHDTKFVNKCIGYVSFQWSDIFSAADAAEKQGGTFVWSFDSNYVKPFKFMSFLTNANFNRTSKVFR
jgi:hypothetical protein